MSSFRISGLRASIACFFALALPLIASLPAGAQERISRDPSFNARAWSLTTPDADGIRYIGGDFTSYNAWNTGRAAVISTANGTVNPTFPKVTGGLNYDVAPDGAGGYFIAGGITSVDGTTRSRVARIRADGSLDPDFNPTINNTVTSIEVVGENVIIGGLFTSVNGVARNRIAALDTSGNLLSFDPNADSWVMGLYVDGDDLYLLGPFNNVGGEARSKVARVRLGNRTGGTNGTCLTSYDQADCLTGFAPAVDGWGALVARRWNSTLFVGGSLGTGNHLQAFNINTGAAETSWAFAVNNEVMDLEVVGSTLYAAGQFTAAKGAARTMVASFDLDNTGAITPWSPTLKAGGNYSKDGGNRAVFDIDVIEDTAFLAGSFWSINGTPRNRLGSVSVSTGTVTDWDPHIADWSNGVVSTVRGIEITGDQAMIVGDFDYVGGLKRNHLAAVEANGVLADWAPSVDGPVFSVSRSGASIYLVGQFGAVEGATRPYAAAITTAGSVTAWDPQPGGSRPVSVIATPGKVYLGGFFSTMGGVSRPAVAAVDPTTGALDANFDAAVDGHVRGMALHGSTLYFGGDFTSAGGASRDRVAAVDISNGTARPWDVGTLGATHGRGIYIENVTMDVDGSRVFLGGSFTSITPPGSATPVTRNYAVALDPVSGAIDSQWAPPLIGDVNGRGDVYAIAPTASAIYLGGQTQMNLSAGGQSRYGVGAVDPITGSILPWAADTGEVRGLSTSATTVYLVGSFSSVGNATRYNSAAVGLDSTVLDPWPMTKGLTVTTSGPGTGTVESNPGGILCGVSCTYGFADGQTVTLTAVPAAGADFEGWTGSCTGTATTCILTMSSAQTATANFVPAAPGSGGGSSPGSASPIVDAPTNADGTATSSPLVSNAFTLGRARMVGGAATIRTRVPGAGVVRIRVTRTVSGKRRAAREVGVCTTRTRVTGERVLVLRCRLNARTRTLRAARSMRLHIYVTYAPAGGAPALKTRTLRIAKLRPSVAEAVTG